MKTMKTWTKTVKLLIEAGVQSDRLPSEWQPGIDLTRANLPRANLPRANLTRANLTGAKGPFATGSFGRHNAIAAGGFIAIGCERHSYDHWLEHFAAIGAANGYTEDEIDDYGAWIQLAVARQRRIEAAGE